MFKNYLKIALRNLSKQKGYSLINVLGLAIGMTCCMLILLYVLDELSYDRYHQHADRIYRIVEDLRQDGVGEVSSSQRFPVAVTLANDYPDLVEAAVRFFNFQAPTLTVGYEDRRFNEPRFFFADPSVFEVFSFNIIAGDFEAPLREPYSVVITRDMARKYFGDENPLGKILLFEDQYAMKVTAVLENVPSNSHFQFDFLASFSSLETMVEPGTLESWWWNPCWTYVLLKENITPAMLETQFPGFIQKYFPEQIKDRDRLYLQPLTEIHLRSKLDFEIEANSDIAYVYIFSAVAFFVLLIACINFMNLATARSANRAREVGMRKVLGAHRRQLAKQFLGESILLSFIALLLTMMFIEIILPPFNSFTGKSLSSNYLTNAWIPLSLISIALLVGLISGAYPAFFLSHFQPISVLKGNPSQSPLGKAGNKGGLRKILVVAQFTISIILIVATIVASQQLNFLRSERLGFNKEAVVMIPVFRTSLAQQYEEFKNRLLQNPTILSVSGAEDVIGAKYQTTPYQPEGLLGEQTRQFPRLLVLHDFIETMGVELLAGRSFSLDFPVDSTQSVMINESAARYAGWTPEEAVGKNFLVGERPQYVVGVFKDFHFASLHQSIDPFVLDMPNSRRAIARFIRYIAVRINPSDIPATLGYIQEAWEAFDTGRAFEYFFLSDELDKLYRAEEKLSKIFIIFSFLAIFVACLGLYALASFTTEQRTREMGIRKVLGASVANIMLILSREFVKLVLIAIIFAWPLAYFASERWLEDFAYRIDLTAPPFLFAAAIAFIITLLTISYQSIKAALSNPVEALKYE